MDIHEFHQYNRLVRRELVDPLTCDVCGFELITRMTLDADPLLQCLSCNVTIQPGLNLYNRIVAVNKEFYL